ncbi:IclR family transcriptional regulator [Streptomyces violaceusniger]|uniref:IclR family transcriptional regulator n=1 Tax=Streptomyces violaceusniger TaxID=68280 RepID=UPI00099876F4|nr:IclR family transcriptional regulator [Streptomyces hygroscopicus]AQW48392.1 IclR family transcriptional regulator [Streptomyces hygroscopicus]
MNVTAEKPAALLQTLERGLQVLEAIAIAEQGATAKALSSKVGIKISTCYHILRTLVNNNYVIRLPHGRYGIGERAAALIPHTQRSRAAPPPLTALVHRLHNRTQEDSFLTGWSDEALVLRQRVPEAANAAATQPMALHACAAGKAVLAYLTPEQVDATLTSGLRSLTPYTITDYDYLRADLARTRRRGYALDIEEFSPGACSAAAAYFDATGLPLGSFAISASKPRFEAHRVELVRQVQEVAAMANLIFNPRHRAVPRT